MQRAALLLKDFAETKDSGGIVVVCGAQSRGALYRLTPYGLEQTKLTNNKKEQHGREANFQNWRSSRANVRHLQRRTRSRRRCREQERKNHARKLSNMRIARSL